MTHIQRDEASEEGLRERCVDVFEVGWMTDVATSTLGCGVILYSSVQFCAVQYSTVPYQYFAG